MSIQDYTESKLEEIRQLYDNGMTLSKISKLLGINSYYIYRLADKYQFPNLNKRKFNSKQIKEMETKILELFDEGKSIYQIYKITTLSEPAISRILKKNNRDTSRNSTYKGLIDKEMEIVNKYHELKSAIKVAKFFNANTTYILKILKRHGIKVQNPKKYSFNYNFFEKIDTDAKAYCLGLLYADGNIKTNINGVSLSLIDEQIITDFKKEINFDGKTYITHKKKFEQYQPKQQFSILLCNAKFREDLIKLGCGPQKTFTLKFPTSEQVPHEFIPAFIRGYCDGDGSIGYTFGKDKLIKFKVQFTSTKEFCEGIKEWYDKQGFNDGVAKVYKANNKHDRNTYYCFISGKRCVPFLQKIYEGSTIHLHRKWMKFKQLEEYYQYRYLLKIPSGRIKGKRYLVRNQYMKEGIYIN